MQDRDTPDLEGRLDDDGVRIWNPENEGAWITAEYEDGWVNRKLLTTDKTEYEEMIHPYYQRCVMCREWETMMMWHVDSDYCPGCEQWRDFILPLVMEWLGGDRELGDSERTAIDDV